MVSMNALSFVLDYEDLESLKEKYKDVQKWCELC